MNRKGYSVADQVFRIVPASNTPLVFLTLITLLLLALLLLFVYFGFLSKQTTVSVGSEGLTVSGWPYGRTLSLDKLDVDGAAVVSLDGTPYAPRARSNGVGLPATTWAGSASRTVNAVCCS